MTGKIGSGKKYYILVSDNKFNREKSSIYEGDCLLIILKILQYFF